MRIAPLLGLVLLACGQKPAQTAPCPCEASHEHPERHHHEEDAHTHHHEMPGTSSSVHAQSETPPHGVVVRHEDLKSFGNHESSLVGLATRSHGAQSFEVWRSRVAPGGKTPLHVHDTEEVFILLSGKGRMTIGDSVIEFEAPATVIAPAGIPHQLENTGDVPTDQIVIVGIDSEIVDADGNVMDLPWRR